MHLRRHGNLERTIMATPIPASSILDALPSEVSRGLFAQGRSVSLDAEQTLFLAGDKGDGCYRVEEGLLKASVGAPNGSERILGILGPGSVVGELSMIDGAPRSASVTALRDSKLYFVSQADFDAIGKSNPEIYRDVMKMLARRLRDTNDALAASSFLSVKGRVARALLSLAEAFGKDVGNGRILIRQKVNQSDLAAMAGIARENVSRVLKDWNASEIYITENGCSATDVPAADGVVYDTDRIMFLRSYLTQLQRATSEGVPVRGYFHWSLMDNFEWADGFGTRFGLLYVDYATQQRTPKLSASFYREVAARNRLV